MMVAFSLPRIRILAVIALCAAAQASIAQSADCPAQAAESATSAGTACVVPHPMELPLPSSTLLMGIGALGVGWALRKKK